MNAHDLAAFNAKLIRDRRRARRWSSAGMIAAGLACLSVLLIPAVPVVGFAALPLLMVAIFAIERS